MTRIFNYIERQSPIHRLTGATKLICLLLWSFAAMVSYDTRLLSTPVSSKPKDNVKRFPDFPFQPDDMQSGLPVNQPPLLLSSDSVAFQASSERRLCAFVLLVRMGVLPFLRKDSH